MTEPTVNTDPIAALDWYRTKLREVEQDLQDARLGNNYTAVANLYTKSQGFREKYDQLAVEAEKASHTDLSTLSEERLFALIEDTISELPLSLLERLAGSIRTQLE